jgi:hypothetical protein
MKAYVGCGASDTPSDVLEMMFKVAGVMSGKGIMLRCSEIGKADEAFVKGSKGRFHTFIPHGLIDESLDEPSAATYSASVWGIPSAIDPASADATFARSLDPKFLMLSKPEKQWEVVANSLIYGLDRTSVAKMLICWSQPGDHVERYLKKAEKAGVKVYNLALTKDRATIQSWIGSN